MTDPARSWTGELPALVRCGLVPKLPGFQTLRSRADAAVQHPCSSGSSTSTPPGAELLFRSQQLYDAVRQCVEETEDFPEKDRAATSLLISSLAMEDYVRSHSTKARLVAAQHARFSRQAMEQQQEVKRAEAASSESELLNFLLLSSKDQIVERLLDLLREPEDQRSNLRRVVSKHPPTELAAILSASMQACAAGDTQRTDGGGSRTLGGIFFREAKRRKASADCTDARLRLPPLPPLYPHQRDVVGVALLSWGLALTEEVLTGEGEGGEGGGGEVEAARRQRLRARFQALAGGWSGNWLVSSPTNSGKTRMFVEVTRGVIASQPAGRCALVVVLVPNVILTHQHSAAFDAAGLPRTCSGAYSSDNPLGPREWGALALAAHAGSHHSVVVATAESFGNLLRLGKAMMAQVDLLVLDEAHHCKDEHPYAQIMTFYNNTAPGSRRPRVLAVTASPASEKNTAALDRRMDALLSCLGAQLHLVDREEPAVVAVLPEPSLREVRVAMRRVDAEIMWTLQEFAINAGLEIESALAGARVHGGTAWTEKERLEEALLTAIAACNFVGPSTEWRSPQPRVNRLDALGQWLSKGREFALRYGCPHLDLCCRLLDVLRKAVELVEDAGFEGALPFLGRKAAALCRAELRAGGGGVAPPVLAPAPPATDIRLAMFAGAVEAVERLRAAEAANGCGSRAVERPAFSGGGGGGGLSHALAALAGLAAGLPTGHEVAARLEMGKAAAAGAPPPGNSFDDISLRASKLLRDMLVGEGGVLTVPERDRERLPEMERLARDCFMSGQLTEEYTFPKFWALLKYLQTYENQAEFHGIIFVRMRQAVFYVTDMIRRTAQLQFVEVLELIGHNNSTKRNTLSLEEDRHGRGMSDSQQQQVLHLFKEPGRKVLVATSAAEEGLDVPSCEFVVRYNAAATGIQLLQSRGRARQRVAEFCAILQDGTLDTSLHQKSQTEEANMHEWQRTAAAVNRGTVAP